MNALLVAIRADMERAGFTHDECVAFLAAIDKPAREPTTAEFGLLCRYEDAVSGSEAGAA